MFKLTNQNLNGVIFNQSIVFEMNRFKSIDSIFAIVEMNFYKRNIIQLDFNESWLFFQLNCFASWSQMRERTKEKEFKTSCLNNN